MADLGNLIGYYSRYDRSKNYERHLVIAGNGAQSAEQNEIQESILDRMKRLGDVILTDGDLVKDCQCVVDSFTGVTQVQAGELYIRGAVRNVGPGAFTVPVDQTIQIGVRLVETIITDLEDPALREPAPLTRNYDEPGAARLEITLAWGWEGDGQEGEFFAVYTCENGILLSKEPPPQLDGVTKAIADYDRRSAGGNYVITGFSVTAQFDAVGSKLVYLVGEGTAQVNGFKVTAPRSIRKIEDMDRETLAITAEPHTFTPAGNGKMRINLFQAPLVTLERVTITAQKLVTLTHGLSSGAKDVLPDNSVLSIVAVNQGGTWNGTAFVGGTTYTAETDYKLTAGQVDWTPSGGEPAPGATYSCVYRYQTTNVTTEAIDATGFTLSGAVAGTLVTVDYRFALPRVDAIVLDEEGRVLRIKGVATQYNPAPPSVPVTQLRIASLQHSWDGDPVVTMDAVVVMPMQELQAMRGMVLDLFDLVAQERLRNDIGLAEPAAKRGVFVDPMNNNNLRDAGIAQTAAVLNGQLMLAVDATVFAIGEAIKTAATLDYVLETIVEQPFRTGSMLVNPYQAFDPIPADVTLEPAVDYWTVTNTIWASSTTERLFIGWGRASTSWGSEDRVTTTSVDAEFLRQIVVKFKIAGFGPGEMLQSLTFDGIAVTPTAA